MPIPSCSESLHVLSLYLEVPSCDPQKPPDTPGSPEGNTEGPEPLPVLA